MGHVEGRYCQWRITRELCVHMHPQLSVGTLDKTGRHSDGLASLPHLFFKIPFFFLGYSGQRLTSSEMAKGRQPVRSGGANGWGKTQTVIGL